MNIIKPPTFIPQSSSFKIFLAGSIEMGAAENWQDRFAKEFADQEIDFLNPRRNNWNSEWEQNSEVPEFRAQVEWELQGHEQANLIVMYFDPATKSPISLLELGLFARSNKLLVCCPKGFWRRGNVQIVCQKYGLPFVENLDDLVKATKQQISRLK